MNTLSALIKRNVSLFFKDKGMFFTSLITPFILLVLYATFLGNVYRDAFNAHLPQGITLPEALLDGMVGGQLLSSILAVSCVTVAFGANFLMVQDKARGTVKDLRISPVSSPVLSLSYYAATLLSTLLICLCATGACLLYLAIVGWYLTAADVLWLLLDVGLLSLFGTALSSLINRFLSTQGQISAVGSIVSSCYGFICGAYMPISTFGEGLQTALSFLPGTYGTALLRTHALRSALDELPKLGLSYETVESLTDALDCRVYFFDQAVSAPMMYLILGGAVVLLIGVYLLIQLPQKKATK